MNAIIPTSTSHNGQWAAVLLALAMSCFTWTASAKDEVPQKGTETSQVISSHTNEDGSVDTISMVVGVASHLGRYASVHYSHVLAPVYDPASNSLIYSFTYTRTSTAANGDQWEAAGEGTEIVPLDANFAPLPPPWALSGTYEQDGGSTFHGTFQGFDFGDGTLSGRWAGITLSGGTQTKK